MKKFYFVFVLLLMFILSGCVNRIDYDNKNYPVTGTVSMKVENQGQKIDFSDANHQSILRIKNGSYILLEPTNKNSAAIKITELKLSDINKQEETATLSFQYTNLLPDTYTINDSYVSFEYLKTPSSTPKVKKLDIRCEPVFHVKGEISHSAYGYEGIYDGLEHTITLQNTSPDDVIVKYGMSKDNMTLDECPTFKNAGKYIVYYQLTKEHYHPVISSATVNISKAQLEYDISNLTVEYNGEYQSPIFNCKDNVNIKFGLEEDKITLDEIPSFKEVGKYKIYYKIEDKNYETVVSSTVFTIKGKTIEYKAQGANVIYDGKEYGASIDLLNVDDAIIRYGTDYNNVTMLESPKFKDLGIYTVYYTISAENYETEAGKVKIAITKYGISDEELYKDEYLNEVDNNHSYFYITVLVGIGITGYFVLKKRLKK